MNAIQEELFSELRQTQLEILAALQNKQEDEWMTPILQEELADINLAIEKFANGNFGHCETTGQPIPDDLLRMLPTMKTAKDTVLVNHYYRKPLHSFFRM
jgi:RNA polymerase-binding transcription factor DksA